jgi:hypothetical protein
MKGLRIEMKVAMCCYIGGDIDPNGDAPPATRNADAAEMFRLVRAQEFTAIDGIPTGDLIGSIVEVMLAEASSTAAACLASSLQLNKHS